MSSYKNTLDLRSLSQRVELDLRRGEVRVDYMVSVGLLPQTLHMTEKAWKKGFLQNRDV